MKRLPILLLLFSLLLAGCGTEENNDMPQAGNSEEMTTQSHIVTVEEKIDAGSYSYLLVSENEKSYWIAVPKSNINPGEVIKYSQYMEMKNFRSETLDRTFESVLFVDDARTGNETPMENPHQMQLSSIPKEKVEMKKAEDGFSIEELFLKKDELVNKTIKVRGKVVKANLGIMNRNWFHIQDGTGSQGTHDLTVTSNDEAKIGDVILVEGKLVKDKDFGSGYTYALLIEDSRIKVE